MKLPPLEGIFSACSRATRRHLPGLVVGLGLLLGANAKASMVVVGTGNGEVFGRSEFDLATHLPNSYLNFGTGVSIDALSSDSQGNVAIGTNISISANVSVRPSTDLATVITSLSTGGAITAMAPGSTGQLAFGDAGNLLFQRQFTDLLAYPPGYTSTDGVNFGSPITAVTILPNGNVVIGTESGMMAIRSGSNLLETPAGAATGFVNFGVAVTSLAVDSNGQIVVGLQNGIVQVRPPEDIAAVGSSVNFGTGITAVCSMMDGTVAIGLETGQVSLRTTSDLTLNLQTVSFTGGSAVTAIAYSPEGNLGIGTADNLVFVRQGDDMLLLPAGFVGADGLNFGAPITALTFAIPEPSSGALLAIGLGCAILAKRKKRCVMA